VKIENFPKNERDEAKKKKLNFSSRLLARGCAHRRRLLARYQEFLINYLKNASI
jgi:hypothetical protein